MAETGGETTPSRPTKITEPPRGTVRIESPSGLTIVGCSAKRCPSRASSADTASETTPKTMKMPRQPKYCPKTPPSVLPTIWPIINALMNRASAIWRAWYGNLSPM